MKARGRKLFLPVLAAVVALTFALQLAAQSSPSHRFHQYRLTEIGTFGGPWSLIPSGPANAYGTFYNGGGAVAGAAQSNVIDPFSPNCVWGNCYAGDAFVFENGTLINLLSLPGSSNSFAYEINDWGFAAGVSETGAIDPATGYPEYHAVAWSNGAIADLGTLGGSDSAAYAVNDRGEVVGGAFNNVPDQYGSALGALWPVTTQQRAFLWRNGQIQDLGTLGGNDAVAYALNRRGQIAGISYTNTTPNATTGLPTQDPFLWDRGRMIDLGTLGGTSGNVQWLNDRGQVVGISNLAGDQAHHAFLWERGVLKDLGTLGGVNSDAYQVNSAGDVLGVADTSSGTTHGFLWNHATRAMSDIPPLPGYDLADADAFNDEGIVVGNSCTNGCQGSETAMLWVKGAEVDLNALVTPPSDLHLLFGYLISDSGVIYALGVLPNGDYRIAVLTPANDCDTSCEQRIADSENVPTTSQPANMGAPRPAFGGAASETRGPWSAISMPERPLNPHRPTTSESDSSAQTLAGDRGPDFLRDPVLPPTCCAGLCEAHWVTGGGTSGQWELTGNCVSSIFGYCTAGRSINCPAGAKALHPAPSRCTGGPREVDLRRLCD